MDSALLCRAFDFACAAHGDQVRKGHPVPFIAHPMAVSSLVLEYGGDTETAAAALLHDTIEDTPTTAESLREAFGERVAAIVVACTDNLPPCPPEWRARKERFLRDVRQADSAVHLVFAADKLHNARDVVREQREIGDAAFRIFVGRKDGTLWYYRAALNVLDETAGDDPGLRALLGDLRREVETMESLAGQ